MTSTALPSTWSTLDANVARSQAGDRAALDAVIRALQPDVYNLALRFLWHQQDAEDATQEILMRVVRAVGEFRGESNFRTWVYRIACNRLLTLRKQRAEHSALSLEEFGEDLGRGLSDSPFSSEVDADESLMLEEVKIGCTLALLQCLDSDQRLAYILGDVLELDHTDAAAALETTPAAYRKRLSRARATITSFLTSRCGLVNPASPCRCRRRVGTAVALGRVDPANLHFASSLEQARRFPEVLARIRQLEDARRAAALYQSHSAALPSAAFTAWLKQLLEGLQVHGAD
jgi:RNA polymerase sigma factor (sigma-70 family)